MRGAVAKRLRKAVYEDKSLHNRKYFRKDGHVVADSDRQLYQFAKKEHKLTN